MQLEQQTTPVRDKLNPDFSILDAVSSDDGDSCSSGDSDADAAIHETPDDLVFAADNWSQSPVASANSRNQVNLALESVGNQTEL